MTRNASPALDTALAYYRAWTSQDFSRAMTYVATHTSLRPTPVGRRQAA